MSGFLAPAESFNGTFTVTALTDTTITYALAGEPIVAVNNGTVGLPFAPVQKGYVGSNTWLNIELP